MNNSTRYKPYPRYKESGVEWLGKLPDRWQTRKLKFAAPPDARGSFRIKGDVGLDQREDLFPGFSAAGQDVWVEHADYETPGIVLSAIGARCGKCFKADGKWSALANTQVFLPDSGFFRDYVWYVVNREAFWLKGGSAQPYVQVAASINQIIPYPSLPEQRAIAEFLDRETAKIDELIAKKERLIGLLEEKRAALIAHAVTRGLNPNIPRRDSGIEWLGQIPAHWDVRSLKNEFRFQKGRNAQLLTASYIKDNEGEYPVYSGQTENDGIMGFLSSYEYDVPEVLFATTVGAKAMTPMTLKGKFSLSQNCLIMRPKKDGTVTRFFYYQLHPLFAFERGSIPAHMQPSLRISDLRSYAVACPMTEEQNEIANYLDDASTRMRTLRERVQDAIDKLTEYRSALLTAAVTGKIDVRDEIKAAA